MKNKIAESWGSIDSRERLFIIGGATLLAVILIYAYAWRPLTMELARLRVAAPEMREAARWMHEAAVEAKRLQKFVGGSAQTISKTGDIKSVLTDSSSSGGLAGITVIPESKRRAGVSFESVGFGDFINWIVLLRSSHGLEMKSCEIKTLTKPGRVSVKAVFSRPE